jgi:hypothetical protein
MSKGVEFYVLSASKPSRDKSGLLSCHDGLKQSADTAGYISVVVFVWVQYAENSFPV